MWRYAPHSLRGYSVLSGTAFYENIYWLPIKISFLAAQLCMIGCTAALSQSHGCAFDLSLASKVLSKSCKEALRHIPQRRAAATENSYPGIFFCSLRWGDQKCKIKKIKMWIWASAGKHAFFIFGTLTQLPTKVFIQGFVVGAEWKKTGKTWVIGCTSCFLLVLHFLGWMGETWQACQIFYTVAAVIAKREQKKMAPSGKRGG